MKRVLITGANSYIGDAAADYLSKNKYEVGILNVKDMEPCIESFAGYDVVINVAGIAHRKENRRNRDIYFKINRDLCIQIATCAKEAGVSQFIALSSMSVYGCVTGYISKVASPNPRDAYGKSKLQADRRLLKLSDNQFRVAILRPPMVYGKGCKGNYQLLRSIALKSKIFPKVGNVRSMIYIENLCEFIRQCIDCCKQGIFFPQNSEYVCTDEMVKMIAEQNCRDIIIIPGMEILLRHFPVKTLKKAFGSLTYEKTDLVDRVSFAKSIELTER